ncbi:hypothetical protein [Pradoshia sp.]
MRAYQMLISAMLILISVFSIKNLITGQWDIQYAMTNGGMAIIVLGIYTGYMKYLQEQQS